MMSLPTKVLVIWALTVICASLLRTFGTHRFILGLGSRVFLSNVVAYWLCLLVGFALSIRPLIKAFTEDFLYPVSCK